MKALVTGANGFIGKNLIAFLEQLKDVVLFAYEGEREQSLATVLQQVPHLQHIALLVGPEGGFTEEEAGRLIAAGAKPVSLGPRIMRTETAALALTAIVMYHYGQMEVIS